jgi:hypothetical protein
MNLLLASACIKNKSIHDALVDLLGKPIAESNALFIPTAIYPFPGGAGMAWQAICGKAPSPLCQLGWKSLGALELTALSSIDKKALGPFGGGDGRPAGLGRRSPVPQLLDAAVRTDRPPAVVAARSGLCGSERRQHGGVRHLRRDLP